MDFINGIRILAEITFVLSPQLTRLTDRQTDLSWIIPPAWMQRGKDRMVL